MFGVTALLPVRVVSRLKVNEKEQKKKRKKHIFP